jgi:hypothetical protein
MKKNVKCPKCGHVFVVAPATRQTGELKAELLERRRQLAFELESIIFHQGLLAEEERRVRRERWELDRRLGG